MVYTVSGPQPVSRHIREHCIYRKFGLCVHVRAVGAYSAGAAAGGPKYWYPVIIIHERGKR